MTREHIPQQVEAIAAEFAPEVVRVVWALENDWAGDEALFFRIVISDATAEDRPSLNAIARMLEDRLHEALCGLRTALYFNYRSASECARMKDPEWMAA